MLTLGMVAPDRILVIKLRHLGDVLLSTPVLTALRAAFPKACLSMLVNPGTEAMIAERGRSPLRQLRFATAVGGIPEVVRDGETGVLVPARDPRRFAEAILGLLEAPGLARVMGDEGRRRIQALFALEEEALQKGAGRLLAAFGAAFASRTVVKRSLEYLSTAWAHMGTVDKVG